MSSDSPSGKPSRRPAESNDAEAASKPRTGALLIVATPIGNLGDATLRAVEALRGADILACEDTRVTRKLLRAHAIDRSLTAYHEHNAERVRPRLIEAMKSGKDVALVSDAGTPLISDPGYKLVRAALEAGLRVSPLPGASAILAALVASGLPSDRFLFEGFLSAKAAARKQTLELLRDVPATLVFFETGKRLGASLRQMAAVLGPREAAVCRELTKIYEEVVRGPLDGLVERYGSAPAPKGEIVVVVAPPLKNDVTEQDLDEKLRSALARNSLRDAVQAVAETTGLPRRRVYARALALEQESLAQEGRDS